MARGGVVDRQDLRILRELMRGQMAPVSAGFRISYAALARRLAMDEGTVRNRVKKLHTAGIIRQWEVLLNPRLSGGGEINVWTDVAPGVAKDGLIQEILLLDGPVIIANFRGPFVAVVLRYADENSVLRQVDLIRRLAQAETVGIGRVPFPESKIRFSDSDWRVLKALCRSPRKPLAFVAREVGLSSRSVKRKVERMVQGGAVFALPWVDPRGLEGGVMATLHVTYKSEDGNGIDQRFVSTFDDIFVHAFHMLPFRPGDPTPCSYNMILPNVPAASEVLRWAEEQPDILSARVELFEETFYRHSPLERQQLGLPEFAPLPPAMEGSGSRGRPRPKPR